ncbi:hypothetical protein KPH14_006106 [Odynerus spinipes]|uniref:Uncharacterized protein n=1 Tax=Odynerus spinipes TaxID=1348599 RepID=A0AAD9RKT8_9HYME|nr:hypothetical protein KPH14_006106 [Odynerus spinipes]
MVQQKGSAAFLFIAVISEVKETKSENGDVDISDVSSESWRVIKAIVTPEGFRNEEKEVREDDEVANGYEDDEPESRSRAITAIKASAYVNLTRRH